MVVDALSAMEEGESGKREWGLTWESGPNKSGIKDQGFKRQVMGIEQKQG